MDIYFWVGIIVSYVLATVSYRLGVADGIRLKKEKNEDKQKKPKKERATHISEGIEKDIANILNYQNRRMKKDED